MNKLLTIVVVLGLLGLPLEAGEKSYGFSERVIAPSRSTVTTTGGIGVHSLESLSNQIRAHQRSTESMYHQLHQRARRNAESLARLDRLDSMVRTTGYERPVYDMNFQVHCPLVPTRSVVSLIRDARSAGLDDLFDVLGEFEGSPGWVGELTGVAWKHLDYAVSGEEFREVISKRPVGEHLLIGGSKVVDAAIKHDTDGLDRWLAKRWPKLRPGLVGGAIEIGGQLQSALGSINGAGIWAQQAQAHPYDTAVGLQGVSNLLKASPLVGLPPLAAAAGVLDQAIEVGQEIRSSVLQQRTMSMIALPRMLQPVGILENDQSIDTYSGQFSGRSADNRICFEGGWALEHPGDRDWNFGRMFLPNSRYVGWTRTSLDNQRMADGSVFTGTIGGTWNQSEDSNGVKYKKTRTVRGVSVIRRNGVQMNRDIQRAMAAEAKGETWTRNKSIRAVPIPNVSESDPPAGRDGGVSMKMDLIPASFKTDQTGQMKEQRKKLLQSLRRNE